MAHYAKVDENNIVQAVIKFDDSVEPGVPQAPVPDGWKWVQTSYNASIRKKFAGIGDTHDENADVFIPSKPYASWVLNEETWLWESPVERPTYDPENLVVWNESNQSWDPVE
jgi:hypothetical protein